MAVAFKLEQPDGSPADPPTFKASYRTGRPVTRSRSGTAEHCA
jgi:hypothetical protein